MTESISFSSRAAKGLLYYALGLQINIWQSVGKMYNLLICIYIQKLKLHLDQCSSFDIVSVSLYQVLLVLAINKTVWNCNNTAEFHSCVNNLWKGLALAMSMTV